MEQSPRYVGFWMRTLATVVDMIVLTVIILLLLWAVYGTAYFTQLMKLFSAVYGNAQFDPSDLSSIPAGPADVLIQLVPIVLLFVFWRYRCATPGKMLISARIVDAGTLKPPSNGQLIGRFFAYIVSTLPLFLGFLWIAFDRRKQGWHDKLAGTVVIYDTKS